VSDRRKLRILSFTHSLRHSLLTHSLTDQIHTHQSAVLSSSCPDRYSGAIISYYNKHTEHIRIHISYTQILRYSYTHTLIYSYTHVLIHSYTHILIYSYAHILIYSYTHILIYSYTHIHPYYYKLVFHKMAEVSLAEERAGSP